MNRKTRESGFTLVEVVAAMLMGGMALGAFLYTVKPSIDSNKRARTHIDNSGALAEVLDSTMTLPVSVLDGMNGSIFKSRQGVQVLLTVSSFNQADADAIMSGLDVSRMRTLKVSIVSDPARKLSTTISNYNDVVGVQCYD